jgi:nucleotide-binding universal stress UspA family protein
MKRILIPTDFSELSEYARGLALKIAKATSASIHVIHVIPIPSHILLTKEGDLFDDGEMDTKLPRQKKIEAETQIANWIPAELNATTCICFGHVNEETVRYAEQFSIDMIIMGTHGASGMKELISGSHAEYVAMHVPMPVLTLKCERDNLEMKSIVLAGSFLQDDIPHCETVLELQKVFNSKLHLLRVNTTGNFLPDHEAIVHMKAFTQKHELENVEYAVYSDHNIEDGIIQYAAKNNIDMIAIGSMQRTGLSKFILGCVSADLVNHVFKPLLTFRLKNK